MLQPSLCPHWNTAFTRNSKWLSILLKYFQLLYLHRKITLFANTSLLHVDKSNIPHYLGCLHDVRWLIKLNTWERKGHMSLFFQNGVFMGYHSLIVQLWICMKAHILFKSTLLESVIVLQSMWEGDMLLACAVCKTTAYFWCCWHELIMVTRMAKYTISTHTFAIYFSCLWAVGICIWNK